MESFSTIDQSWLLRFLEHRIADKRILRLIRKWLSAGVIENGEWSETIEGSPQGASASPLLANVYLHYVFDRWVQQWRRRHARGDVIVTRFADDSIVGFQHLGDAKQFLRDLRERFAKFNLELHPDKTRLIEFGRFAVHNRSAKGLRRPETFTFLGFTHFCREGEDRGVLAETHHHRAAAADKAEAGQGRAEATHASAPPRTGAMVGERRARTSRVLRRARQLPGRRPIPHPGRLALAARASASWPAAPLELGADETPHRSVAPACSHPASLSRDALRRSYSRQEPSAVVPHAGICAGGRPQGRSLPRSGWTRADGLDFFPDRRARTGRIRTGWTVSVTSPR